MNAGLTSKIREHLLYTYIGSLFDTQNSTVENEEQRFPKRMWECKDKEGFTQDLKTGNLVTPDQMQIESDTGLIHKVIANFLHCALPEWPI